MSRMVRVSGAIVASPRYSNAESRVRMTTGRRLSGRPNLYQRTSPRCTIDPSFDQIPAHRTLLWTLVVWYILRDVWLRVAACESSSDIAGWNLESEPSE